MKNFIKKTLIISIAILFSFNLKFSFADIKVQNKIKAKVNTGGNLIKNGKIIKGKEKIELNINTSVDKKNIQSIKIKLDNNSKTNKIEKNIEYKKDNLEVRTSISLEKSDKDNTTIKRKNLKIKDIELKENIFDKIKNFFSSIIYLFKFIF